jgi:cardiolipin synthase C
LTIAFPNITIIDDSGIKDCCRMQAANRILIYRKLTRLIILLTLSALFAGCSLPSLMDRTDSTALTEIEAKSTRLGQAVADKIEEHPGKSGFYTLRNPRDAFAARMLLARTAERTLDIQYYIWHKDVTGTLLLDALHRAANRGVRVRLLLDDNGTAGLDRELKALDDHPNIEIRLFNPFTIRSARWLGYLVDFSRVNRRMHNKSFTADNQTTIVGGRNIGDEYFGATDGVLFADLDVLCVGPIVSSVSSDFDRYWSSESSYPIGLILRTSDQDRLNQLADTAAKFERDPAAFAYVNTVRQSTFVSELLSGSLPLEWTDIRMVSDHPSKGLNKVQEDGLMANKLKSIVGVPARDVALVSPYFVPTAAGVKAFQDIAARGVRVRILTNSLEATDVAAVHAGYAKWRRELLQSGISLYEMKKTSSESSSNWSPARFGSSGASLHAKTFAVDNERAFVGSFNFDPRSLNLNTELGFVIDSPTLARQIDTGFNSRFPLRAYEVRLNEKGQIYWIEQQERGQILHTQEPGAGLLKRGLVLLLSMLPIEWLL